MYYDFKFLSGTEVSTRNGPVIQGEIGPYFVPFERFRQVDPVHSMVQASKLSQELKLEDNLATRLVENFSRAVNVLVSGQPLQVHVVDEHGQSQTPIAEILELFVRVNSSGLALQRSDLLMSLLDLSWNDVQPVLLRVADSASQNAPVQITRDLVLKSVLLYIGEESRFDRLVKDRDRIERIAPGLKDSLPKIEKAWLKLGVLLRQNCRIHSPRFFRQATNALLPFVVWLADHPKVSQAEENTLVAALHIALMSGVFGGAEARMGAFARNECRGASAFPIKKLARLVRATRPITDLDAMLGHHLDLTLNIAQGGVVLDGNPDELERATTSSPRPDSLPTAWPTLESTHTRTSTSFGRPTTATRRIGRHTNGSSSQGKAHRPIPIRIWRTACSRGSSYSQAHLIASLRSGEQRSAKQLANSFTFRRATSTRCSRSSLRGDPESQVFAPHNRSGMSFVRRGIIVPGSRASPRYRTNPIPALSPPGLRRSSVSIKASRPVADGVSPVTRIWRRALAMSPGVRRSRRSMRWRV